MQRDVLCWTAGAQTLSTHPTAYIYRNINADFVQLKRFFSSGRDACDTATGK